MIGRGSAAHAGLAAAFGEPRGGFVERIAAGVAERGRSDPQQAKQIAELQERVRVLERIVTDGGYDLAHKIEALRDERGVEARLETSTPKGRI